MRTKFFIIPAALLMQLASAQDSAILPMYQAPTTTVTPASSSVTARAITTPANSSAPGDNIVETSIIDYKSVYEAATLEEEVQMAADRYRLTKSQQEIWARAAVDRRETEKQTRATLEKKTEDYNKQDVYKGLRSSQNEFYETIIGYLEPTQKQLLEKDRVIIEEKRKMIAKLPPPVITPTVTVAPVDSAAIYESLKAKNAKQAKQKSKKKKKPIGT